MVEPLVLVIENRTRQVSLPNATRVRKVVLEGKSSPDILATEIMTAQVAICTHPNERSWRAMALTDAMCATCPRSRQRPRYRRGF